MVSKEFLLIYTYVYYCKLKSFELCRDLLTLWIFFGVGNSSTAITCMFAGLQCNCVTKIVHMMMSGVLSINALYKYLWLDCLDGLLIFV